MADDGLSEQERLIEGIASQIRRTDAKRGPLAWWHLIGEAERERYRAKARNHIAQVGWNGEVPSAKTLYVKLWATGSAYRRR